MQKEIKPQILEHKEKHSEKGNKEHKEEKENKEKISDIKQRFEETTQVNSFQNKDALNVGIVGHIDHGKTTILHRLTGVWADKHSEELKRGITIKLGYADLLIRKCTVCGKYVNEEKCTYCKGKTEIAKNISFIDAPGHEMLMATMLGGAAIIDTALLVVAANEPFPQPQTKEHLLALDVKGVKSVIIVQNKLDLITKEQALEQFKKIKEFIKGSIAEKAEIVPICAQQGVNMDVLFDVLNNIPIPERDLISKPLFLIARTFDINRPGTNVCELKGGVFGGTLKRGKLKVGDILEIKPGKATKKHDQTIYKTVETKILGLRTLGENVKEATPSGLLAVETALDPMMTKSDALAGCSCGLKGTLPELAYKIKLKLSLFSEIVGDDKNKSLKIDPLKTSEYLLLSVNTTTTVGLVTSVRKDIAELSLKIPIVPFKGERIGFARNYLNHWRLIGFGEIID